MDDLCANLYSYIHPAASCRDSSNFSSTVRRVSGEKTPGVRPPATLLRPWLRDDDRFLIYRSQLSGMKGAFLRVMFIRSLLLWNNGRGVLLKRLR